MLDATDKILFARGAEAILQEPTAKKKKEGKILQQLEHISCCERSCVPLLTPKQKVPSPPMFADTLQAHHTSILPAILHGSRQERDLFLHVAILLSHKDLNQTSRTGRGRVSNDT